MPPDEDVLAQLAELHVAYAATLPAKLAHLSVAWERTCQPTVDVQASDELHRLAHSLVGSGATFGFPTLSAAAHVLAQYVLDRMSSDPPLPILCDATAPMIAAIYQAADVPQLFISRQVPVVRVAQPREPAESSTLVLLIDNDVEQADDLAIHLRHFGYSVRVFHDLEALPEVVQVEPPAALIVERALIEGATAGRDGLPGLPRGLAQRVPTLLLSSRDDLTARLQAVRTGALSYFVKPINLNALVDTLDRVTERQPPEPYRVLIVEDEPLLMAHYVAVLQRAGMLTAQVSEVAELLPTLRDFSPDLIVMDVYLPDCSGLELAAVIRQQEAYVSIPIVFLSTETERDRQLAALHLGGDDFLTKPITPDHLVATLTSRGQRSRILRSFMVRDSLTGLLNHTRSTEQLGVEIARAARQQTSLTLALLDIDYFKAVNDTYGHPVGDQVIKSLARLLQQRLRRTDLLGRYGGEEFVIILPDTSEAVAAAIIDELREYFATIQHRSAITEFTVTFSCGVASFPQFSEVSQITEAADQALYAAKRSGRNRVVGASAGSLALAGYPERSS